MLYTVPWKMGDHKNKTCTIKMGTKMGWSHKFYNKT